MRAEEEEDTSHRGQRVTDKEDTRPMSVKPTHVALRGGGPGRTTPPGGPPVSPHRRTVGPSTLLTTIPRPSPRGLR